MWYLLGEIAVLLVLATALGVAVGWMLWSWRRRPIPRQEFERLVADRNELYRIKMTSRQPVGPLSAAAAPAPVAAPERPSPEAELQLSSPVAVIDRSPPLDPIDLTGSGLSAGDAVDDLTAIDGIDAEMQRFLAGHGIQRYRQVGSLTDDQIDRLEALLPAADRRIRDDDWIDQARRLYNDKFRPGIS